MKRIVTLSLLAIACLTMQAQTTWHQAKPMQTQTKKQDVKQKLPMRHTHKVCNKILQIECLVMPIEQYML